jgi:DNA helicase HerA-like ATPase
VVGSTGTGKTTILKALSKWLAFERGERVIIYDPQDEYYGRLCSSVRELVESASRPRTISRFYSPERLDDFLALIEGLGNCVFLVDEADKVFPANTQRLPYLQDEILCRGRHKRIGLIWASQRPTKCHTDLLSLSDVLVVGRLIGIADASYMRTNYGFGIQARHDWAVLMGTGERGSLKLTRKEIFSNG